MFNNNNNNRTNNQNQISNANNMQQQNMMGVPTAGLEEMTTLLNTFLHTQTVLLQNINVQPKARENECVAYSVRTKGEPVYKAQISPEKLQYDYYLHKAGIKDPSLYPENPKLFKNNIIMDENDDGNYNQYQVSTYSKICSFERRKKNYTKITNTWCDVPIIPLGNSEPYNPFYQGQISAFPPVKSRKYQHKNQKNNFKNQVLKSSSNISGLYKNNHAKPEKSKILKEEQFQSILLKIEVTTTLQTQYICFKIESIRVSVMTIKILKQELYYHLIGEPCCDNYKNMTLWNESGAKLPDIGYVHYYVDEKSQTNNWILNIDTIIAMKSYAKESAAFNVINIGDLGIRARNQIKIDNIDSSNSKSKFDSINKSEEWAVLDNNTFEDQADYKSYYTSSKSMLTEPILEKIPEKEKSSVSNFVVYCRFGSVTFKKPVDLSKIERIEDHIEIGLHSIEIFNKQKFEKGEGLNQPCIIQLRDWYNLNGLDAYGNIADEEKLIQEAKGGVQKEEIRKEVFFKKMKKLAKKMGGKIILFDYVQNLVELELEWLDCNN